MTNEELELRVKRLEGVVSEFLGYILTLEYAEDIHEQYRKHQEKLTQLKSKVSKEPSFYDYW